jgi:hypothetical protein
MPNDCCINRNMPLSLLPRRQQAATAKALEASDARERAATEARARAMETTLEAGRRALRDRVGADKLAALRAATRHEKVALAALREPPGGLRLDLAKAQRTRRKRADAAARKLGIDPAILRDIGRATDAKLVAALGAPAGRVTDGANLAANLGAWQKLSPLHAYPIDWGVRPPVDPGDPAQFRLFVPPFPLWNTAFNRVESANFKVRHEYNLVESLGVVGNIATMDCDDAGDFDLAHAIVDTEVVFIYQAPRAGRLEVIVDAMNTFGHHDLRIADEWGWSDHWTYQKNYLSLDVFHPAMTARSLALMSQFDHEGSDDATFSVRALTPGNHYYGHMVSDGAVQEGDTFFVGVGTRTFDITRANDVEVHSRSNFQWLIRSVEVRIVP